MEYNKVYSDQQIPWDAPGLIYVYPYPSEVAEQLDAMGLTDAEKKAFSGTVIALLPEDDAFRRMFGK